MMRKLELPSGTWHYKIGVTSAQIRGPNGETINVGAHKINGRSPDDLERGRHKNTDDGMVCAYKAYEAAVRFLSANVDPCDLDPDGVYPILVRRDGGEWEAVAIGIGCEGADENSATYYWEVRGRWTGRKVTPPGSTGAA